MKQFCRNNRVHCSLSHHKNERIQQRPNPRKLNRIGICLLSLFIIIISTNSKANVITITCTGSAGSYKSGSVNSTGIKNDGDMVIINSSANTGWATFDLSSLSGVTIISVDAQFTTFSSTASGANNNLYGFLGDPFVMTGTSLYASCSSGSSFNTASWIANASNLVTLNAAGVSFINANAGGSLNIGYVRGSTNSFNIYGYSGATPPKLVITYIGNPCSGMPSPGNTLASSNTICSGGYVSFSIQNSASTGTTYQWYNSTGAIAGATNAIYASTITTGGNYYCAVTCSSSGLTSNSNPVSITILPATSGSSNVTACNSYTWYGIYTNSANPTHVFTNSIGCDSIHTMNITIIYSSTGSSNATACNSYTWFGVTYTASANPTHIFTNAAGCDSVHTLHITLNSSPPFTQSQSTCSPYTWSVSGMTYTMSGLYTATFTNVSGCDSNWILNLFIDTLNTTTTLSGAIISSNATGVNYKWLNCDNNTIISGATNQNYVATVSGNYAVIVSSPPPSSCIDTSNCVQVTATGIEEHHSYYNMVYPNPNNGSYSICLPSDATLIITSVKGELVLKRKYSKGIHKIDLSDKPNGIYFMKIISGAQYETLKVIKEK